MLRKKLRYAVSSLVLALLLLPGCKKSTEDGFRTIRFIDLLGTGNILQSPFITEAGKQPHAFSEPVKSTPLLDPASAENPYNLKKKLDLETVAMDVLFSPPRSKYVFDISPPPAGILEFGMGIARDDKLEAQKKSLGKEPSRVHFIVRIEPLGKKTIVFQRQLRVPPLGEARTLEFSMHKLELPSPCERARITFLTVGDDGTFSFWHNPVVYSKGRDPLKVILISIDTLRADHLGCYGYQRQTSPTIDTLAQDSVLFEETYASSSWTLPSHVSLFTALPGASHQVYMIKDRIDPAQTMLAEVLRKNNFFCSAFTGSGYVNSVYGFAKGFDRYAQALGPINQVDHAERLSTAVSGWLDRNADKRFFLFLHTYQVHSPYFCPPPYNTMFLGDNPRWGGLNFVNYLGGMPGIFKKIPEEERQDVIGLYDGAISYVDAALIKPLIEKLKEMRLYDRTMIIFTSDHGEEFFDHGAWLHSQSLYEEVLKVPLIIKFPGSKYRGKRVKSLVRLIDVMPTILEELGIKTEGLDMAGQSLTPVIRDKEKQDRTILADTAFFTTWLSPKRVTNSAETWFPDKIAFGTRKNKLIFNRRLTEAEAQYFSPLPPSLPSLELYDLEVDPQEKMNLASQRADQVALMMQAIKEIYGKKRSAEKNQIQEDDKLKELLRALGYIH